MTKQKLAIYGAGDNGVSLALDMQNGLKLRDYSFVGFVDDSKKGKVLDFDILGGKEVLEDIFESGITNIAISLTCNPVNRLKMCLELEKRGFHFPSSFPDSIQPTVKIGKGVFIHETSVLLGYDHKISDYVLVGPNAVIEGRTSIGRGTLVRPFAFVGYNSSIGEGVDIGVRASILPNLVIGDNAVIGPHVLQHKNLKSGMKNLRY